MGREQISERSDINTEHETHQHESFYNFDNLTDVQFEQFITNLDYEQAQFLFSQPEVDQMIERFFELVEKQASSRLSHEEKGALQEKTQLYDEIGNIIFYNQLFTPGHRPDHSKENIQDQAIRATVKIALQGEHLDVCYHLLEHNILQNVHMVKPDVLYNAAKELNWYDRLDYTQDQQKGIDRVRQAIIGWTAYDINFNPKGFESYASEQLENNDFQENLKLLELVNLHFFELANCGYEYEESLAMLQNLADKIREKSNNYLIQSRAEIMMSAMSSGEINPNLINLRQWQSRQNYSVAHRQSNEFLYIDLTRDEVGIYDRSGNLQKILSKESGQIQQIKDLPLISQGDPLKQADSLKEYQLLQSLPIKTLINRDFGVDLAKFDNSVQYYFLNYLKNCTSVQAQELAAFTLKFGDNAFKTFLALSSGQEMAADIFAIGNFEFDTAQAIFGKYAQITDAIQSVRSFLQENFSQTEAYSKEIEEEIIQKLLLKGKNLLVKYANTPDKSAQEILSELETIQANIILTAATFKTLKQENPDLNLEDLTNIHTDIIKGSDVTDKDQEELLQILKANWDKPEFATIYPDLHQHMIQSFDNPHLRYYISRDSSQTGLGSQSILTFQRFQDIVPGITYASGNNVHPSARGSRIGEAAQKSILGQELTKHLVIADAYPKSDVIQHYINKSGFVATGIYRDYEDTGEPYFCMVNDKPVNDKNNYLWRFKTPDELINAANQDALDPDRMVLQVKLGTLKTGDPELDEQSRKADDDAAAFLEPYFKNNFVVTAIVKDAEGNLYLGMEKDQSSRKVTVNQNKREIIEETLPVEASI